MLHKERYMVIIPDNSIASRGLGEDTLKLRGSMGCYGTWVDAFVSLHLCSLL